MDLVPTGDSRSTLFSVTGSCALAFICVFWCLLRSKLILGHFVHLRNSFLYPATYFNETWGNSVFRGTPGICQTWLKLALDFEIGGRTGHRHRARHTHPAGCISPEYSNETKNKTHQLVFLLTAANCHGTFHSLWSCINDRQSCHLLCAQGQAEREGSRPCGRGHQSQQLHRLVLHTTMDGNAPREVSTGQKP